MSLITKVFLFYNELSLIQMQKGRFSNRKGKQHAEEECNCRLNLSL